jgi:hypothetical protein
MKAITRGQTISAATYSAAASPRTSTAAEVDHLPSEAASPPRPRGELPAADPSASASNLKTYEDLRQINYLISPTITATTIILIIRICRNGTLAPLLVAFPSAVLALYLATASTVPPHLRRFVSRYSFCLSSFCLSSSPRPGGMRRADILMSHDMALVIGCCF